MTDPAHPTAETETVETVAASAEAPVAPEIDALRDDLERFKDRYLRGQADFDNYRKRAIREREEAVRYANGSLLERLLPVLDNFDLGLEAARQSADTGAEGILQGMSMVQKQLQDFLRDSGVEAIDAVGAPFDPNLHEAIGQEEADGGVAEGTVLRQLRRGYKLRERLLRPATVIVAKGAGAGATGAE